MRTIIVGSLALLAAVSGTSSLAQPRSDNWQSGQTQSGWDRDSFWRGAPADPRQRIDFMQKRIDRGIADGSLDRREARRAQQDLNVIKRDARNMGRRYDSRQADRIQVRLDNLGQRLRWNRNNQGAPYDRAASRWEDDPRFATQYDASRYYRDDSRYAERRLSDQDEVYRGSDGRYYCKRSDGTTGLIIGGIGGAIAGNVIDGGHNRAAGTLIGGALGAILGKSIDQKNSDVRCK